MSKDKAEEKPYLQDLFEYMSNEHGLILTQYEMLEILSISGKEYDNVQFELGEIERQSYSLSTENAQLREALDTVIFHTLEYLEYNLNDVSSKETIVRLLNVTKKQLLTDNTQENENH